MDISSTSSSGGGAIPTYEKLDDIITILGSTKTTFWPFVENVSGIDTTGIESYRETSTWLVSKDASGNKELQLDFSPYRHVGGVHSYTFNSASSNYLAGQDNTNLSFPANEACSFGCWIYFRDVSTVTMIAKYVANGNQEYKLALDSSNHIELEVFDEGAGASRIGASDTVLVANTWQMVTVTFDGADDDTSMTFYLDGVVDGTGNTETGSWDNMDDTAATINIGAHYSSGTTAADEISGRLAMPFVCGKELTATNVSDLYTLGVLLLGVS